MEASHMSNCTGSVSATPSPEPTPSPSSASSALDYGVAVILAAMLCTLVCALGLNSVFHHCVARCCSRRLGLEARRRGAIANNANNAGLRRDALLALPLSTYYTAHKQHQQQQVSAGAGCAICLSDFADGETVRVLPVCGHRFHVACVDRWLVSRCSCPTCRRRLLSDNVSAGAGDGEEGEGRRARAGRDNQLQVLAAV